MTSAERSLRDHSAVFDGNRPHRLPDRRLLPRGSFQRPLGDNLCGRHSAASGPDVRDDFRLGHGFVLLALWRRQILFGRLFALFLACYGAFRFCIEFVRETPKAYAGLSAYQLMALAMVVAGLAAIALRTGREPASWERWRLAARQG